MARQDRYVWWAVLATGITVRIWGLQQQCLTMDEWYELSLARQSWPDILFASDGFPPLYNVILSLWTDVLGDHAARWLSVTCGVATLFVVRQTGLACCGPFVGNTAAACLAVLPIHVWYSQEARCYALLILLFALLLYSVLRVMRSDRWSDWGLVVLTATMGMYTHYLFAVPIVLLAAIWCLQHRHSSPWRWVPVCLVGAVAAIPLGWLLPHDFATQAAWFDQRPFDAASLGYTYFAWFSGHTLGPSLDELHTLSTVAALRQFAPWIVAVMLTLAALAVSPATLRGTFRQRQAWPLFLLATGPCWVGVLCLAAGLGYQPRYAVWGIVPFVLLIARQAEQAGRAKRVMAGALAMSALCGISIGNRHFVAAYQNPPLQKIAAVIASNHRPDVPVVVISGYMAPVLDYYLQQCEPDRLATTVRLPRDTPAQSRSSAFRRMIGRQWPAEQRYWLLLSRDYHEDPQGELFAWLRSGSRHTTEIVREPGAILYSGVWEAPGFVPTAATR